MGATPKSYSQLGQDLITLDFFRFSPPARKIFLDVGAFDGVGFSNSRLLFEHGWSGVCVEPVLKNYKKLEKLYEHTNVVTVRAAASDYKGEMTLNVATVPWATEWGSDVSSPADDVIERWPDYLWEKESVTATTVDDILQTHNIPHVDFVSIDVEGNEMAVLRGFDLRKYDPRLLVVEYSSPEEQRELLRFMELQGYVSWVDNGQDIFFVRPTALKNWKILFYGLYQRIQYSRPARYAVRLARRVRR
jgi:FkbM family methyltransferase